jgi:hypothetical protein
MIEYIFHFFLTKYSFKKHFNTFHQTLFIYSLIIWNDISIVGYVYKCNKILIFYFKKLIHVQRLNKQSYLVVDYFKA